MSKNISVTARDIYLASLSSGEELAARRLSEKSGVPDNDPMWLLLSEVRRACEEATRCTAELGDATSQAAARIERAEASRAVDDGLATRIIAATATEIAESEHVANAVAGAVRRVEADATRAMHVLEKAIRDFMRRRAAAPVASIVFAFALGVASGCLSIYGTYHVAIGYGQDLGYRAGFNDARIYDRNHR